MSAKEAKNIIEMLINCQNGSCKPRNCGDCDFCTKKIAEIDEALRIAYKGLEILTDITDKVNEIGEAIDEK